MDENIRLYLAANGRQGGLKGGKRQVPKGFAMLTKTKRKAMAKAAAVKRWSQPKKVSA